MLTPHHRQPVSGDGGKSEHVDDEFPRETVAADRFERSEHAVARVVHEHIDATESIDGGRGDRGFVGHIQTQDGDGVCREILYDGRVSSGRGNCHPRAAKSVAILPIPDEQPVTSTVFMAAPRVLTPR